MKKSERLELAENAARKYIKEISLDKILGVFAEEASGGGYYVFVTYNDGEKNGFHNHFMVAVNNKFEVTQCARFEKVFEMFE